MLWLRVTGPDGRRVRRSTGTKDPKIAAAILAMLEWMRTHRSDARDLLQQAFDGAAPLLQLYEAFATNKLPALRERLNDVDLEPYVATWAATPMRSSRGTPKKGTRDDYVRQVRTLFPEGVPFQRSQLTERRVVRWLDELAERGLDEPTQRRYFAALQRFVYELRREGVLTANPLDMVPRPKNNAPRSTHYAYADMRRVLDAMPAGEARAIVALMLGSGMEWAAIERATAADVKSNAERIVHAPGTKTVFRQRDCFVDAWAWPIVNAHVRGKIGHAKLFTMSLDQVRKAFYAAQVACGLVERGEDGNPKREQYHRIHDCRHSWTANRGIGGDDEPAWTMREIARQLGHTDLQMVARIYARLSIDERLLMKERQEREPAQAARAAHADSVTIPVTATKRAKQA